MLLPHHKPTHPKPRKKNRPPLQNTMDHEDEKTPSRATIKVCLFPNCRDKGAGAVYRALQEGLTSEEAIIMESPRCLGNCKQGPNIAINDNIVTGMRPFSAVERVRAELDNPSCKADGLGSRSLDDLDDVLDNIEKL